MNIWIALPSFLFDKNTLTHKQALQIIFQEQMNIWIAIIAIIPSFLFDKTLSHAQTRSANYFPQETFYFDK